MKVVWDHCTAIEHRRWRRPPVAPAGETRAYMRLRGVSAISFDIVFASLHARPERID